MASVASGTSPLSGYESHQADSTNEDADENLWNMVNGMPGSSSSSAAGFSFSPASGSLSSWAMVNAAHGHHAHTSSIGALSPLNLDFEQPGSLPTSSYGETTGPAFSAIPATAEGDFPAGIQFNPDGQQFLAAPDLASFGDHAFDNSFGQTGLSNPYSMMLLVLTQYPPVLDLWDFIDSFGPLESTEHPFQINSTDVPQPQQSSPNVPPWDPTSVKAPAGDSPIFRIEDPSFVSPPPQHQPSPSVGSPASADSRSPGQNKVEAGPSGSGRKSTATSSTAPITIRRVRGGARVGKRKTSPTESPSNASRGSSGASMSQFLIVTPDSVNAHTGKPNPFECFEATRPSQKGRKGPLANDTKENALQVRRVGACFSCHARKVRCDKERPCRNCQKLMVQMPQVICWQFQDFIPVLFPTFIRGHFKKEEMFKFIVENIVSFTVNGVEKPCQVELFSGASFGTTLKIKAKFFTAKTPEVLRHWHSQPSRNSVDLQSRGAVPIGLEMEGNSQRDELRKKAKEYIQSIIQEPTYPEQVTDSLRHTDLPRRILRIVQRYSSRCESPMVKKALSIYAMHYVMTRHLCLTPQSIASLQSTNMVPQNVPFVTLRVLNRQIKSVIDEMLMREMQVLFENFSKSLKPKSRKEWAPCLAAFLVLCLFMESVESAADMFVISQNELDLRNNAQPKWKRSFALDVNREVENLPFKQFAYQFHQVYQTHSKDATAKSFNPLVDDSSTEQAELDSSAMEMVLMLRQFILDPSHCKYPHLPKCSKRTQKEGARKLTSHETGSELDFLCADPVLPNLDENLYPHGTTYNYTGRLVAKFLLSFTNEKYIFGPY